MTPLSPSLLQQRFYCALVLLFPFVWFLSREAADGIARVLILLFLIGVVARLPWIRTDRMHLFCVGLCCAVFLGYGWHLLNVPPELFGGSKARIYLPSVCFFLLLAHGAASWERLSPFALIISSLLGLLAHLAIQTPTEHWSWGWSGQRVDFDIDNAQHAGVLFSTGLLAAITFLPRAVMYTPKAFQPFSAFLMISLIAIMSFGVLVTQVRAAWLALLVALLLMAGVSLTLLLKHQKHVDGRNRKFFLGGTLTTAVLLFSALLVMDAPDRIKERLAREDVSIEALASAARFEAEEKLSSTQVRVASWSAALSWIAQRPLLGWGGHTIKSLIETSPKFDGRFKERFGHLHNSYLETLVAIGLVGFMSILAIVTLLAYRAWLAWRRAWMPTDVFVFACGFFVFWLVVNVFESYIVYPSGFFLNSVVGGFLYAFYLKGAEAARAQGHCNMAAEPYQ